MLLPSFQLHPYLCSDLRTGYEFNCRNPNCAGSAISPRFVLERYEGKSRVETTWFFKILSYVLEESWADSVGDDQMKGC